MICSYRALDGSVFSIRDVAQMPPSCLFGMTGARVFRSRKILPLVKLTIKLSGIVKRMVVHY